MGFGMQRTPKKTFKPKKHEKMLTSTHNIANLISKLNFYKLIPYPMDNCFTGRRDRSRQTTEKVILYKYRQVYRVYIRQVSPRAYFLSSQNDVIASFFVV